MTYCVRRGRPKRGQTRMMSRVEADRRLRRRRITQGAWQRPINALIPPRIKLTLCSDGAMLCSSSNSATLVHQPAADEAHIFANLPPICPDSWMVLPPAPHLPAGPAQSVVVPMPTAAPPPPIRQAPQPGWLGGGEAPPAARTARRSERLRRSFPRRYPTMQDWDDPPYRRAVAASAAASAKK